VNESLQHRVVARVLPDRIDATLVAHRLGSEHAWCWLDGGHGDTAVEHSAWSYLGIATELKIATRGREREFFAGLRATQTPCPVAPASVPTTGFASGWVVALGYEFGVALLGFGQRLADHSEHIAHTVGDDDCAIAPHALALRLDVVLAIHDESGRSELRGTDAAIDTWLDAYGWILNPMKEEMHAGRDDSVRVEAETWRRGDDAFLADVDACRNAIREGDAYVLCLTDTATVRGRFDPLAVYGRLREGGGALRGGVIVAGESALVSASPERFLSVWQNGSGGKSVATHPIKGTRPRGASPEQDTQFSADLAADPKERAENLMIVDLMRNDLSRVCAIGTVRATGFQRVETHPHVHQLVSTVSGALLPGMDIFDTIEACFPGGSMTGAPKGRAIEILGEIEGAPRGLYSGCFGWIDDRGGAELAMTIRSVEISTAERGAHARIGAGAGVTIDSNPAAELAETRLKALPMLEALGPVPGAIL
jgi:para-aminobenzoate synthetase component 1